ncbi:hypothetical protein NKJ95_23745 [Mesorhizobium sp. M0012]|uniref:hypothetical protein n=1 Tax=Mesorhizobium sp. M0012 TaxID=2956840 RepID=UPI00333AD0F4
MPIGYHYSNEDYEDGRTVVSTRDNMDGLTELEKPVEAFLRAAHEQGEALRKGALYLWEDEQVAKRTWETRGKSSRSRKYLYTMEYDENDVIHVGDLEHYSALKDLATAGKPLDDAAAEDYWKGTPRNDKPMVEMLVKKATVKSRLELPPTAADIMRKLFEDGAKDNQSS